MNNLDVKNQPPAYNPYLNHYSNNNSSSSNKSSSIYPDLSAFDPSAPEEIKYVPAELDIPFVQAYPPPSYNSNHSSNIHSSNLHSISVPTYDYAEFGESTDNLIKLATKIAGSVLEQNVEAPKLSPAAKIKAPAQPININFVYVKERQGFWGGLMEVIANSYAAQRPPQVVHVHQAPKSEKELEAEKERQDKNERIAIGVSGGVITAVATYCLGEAYKTYENVEGQFKKFNSLVGQWSANYLHYSVNDNIFIHNITSPMQGILERQKTDSIVQIGCGILAASSGVLMMGGAYAKKRNLYGVALVLGVTATVAGLFRYGQRRNDERDREDAVKITQYIQGRKDKQSVNS